MKINTQSFIGSPMLAAVFLSRCCSIGSFIQKPVASEEALGSALKAPGMFTWVESMTSPRPVPADPAAQSTCQAPGSQATVLEESLPFGVCNQLSSQKTNSLPPSHTYPPLKGKKAGLAISPSLPFSVSVPRHSHCRCLTAPSLPMSMCKEPAPKPRREVPQP